MGKSIRGTLLLTMASGLLLAAPGSAAGVTFSNTNVISPNDGMQQEAPIAVSGLTGTVSKVRVSLVNFGHDSPADMDILLVAPGGQRAMVMSDTCGDVGLVNSTLFFDDSAGGNAAGTCAGGSTYKPTDNAPVDAFSAPAPTAGPYPATFSGFVGAAPNGTWSLFAVDDSVNADLVFIANGWTLDLDIAPPAVPVVPAAATTAAATLKKCKKGRKLKRGKCVKKEEKEAVAPD